MKVYNFNLSNEYVEKHIHQFIKVLMNYYIGIKDICGETDELTLEIKGNLIKVLMQPTLECKLIMKEFLSDCYEAVGGQIDEYYMKNDKDLFEMFKDLAYLELTA